MFTAEEPQVITYEQKENMNLANEDRVMGITTQSYLENPAAFANLKLYTHEWFPAVTFHFRKVSSIIFIKYQNTNSIWYDTRHKHRSKPGLEIIKSDEFQGKHSKNHKVYKSTSWLIQNVGLGW